MQLALEQLGAHLAQGVRPLYTLHGDEPLQQQEAADAIRAAARAAGYTERSVHTVQGAHFDWSSLLAAGSALSLFAERQILDIRIPSGKPGGKEGAAALAQLATQAGSAPDTLTLIQLPRLDAASKKTAWFTALDAHGIHIPIHPIERDKLPAWIAQRLKAQGQQVAAGKEGQRSLAFFADRVEGNLLAAHQEIQKLGLLYPPGELSLAQIEQAVLNVARYDVFKLSEAVLSGDLARSTRMLDGLQAEGVAEVLVHWTLAEDIRNLQRARSALDAGQPLAVALRQLRIWGPKEQLFARLLPGARPAALAKLLLAAHQVDGIVKGLHMPGWPPQPWPALHQLVGEMVRALHPRPTPGTRTGR